MALAKNTGVTPGPVSPSVETATERGLASLPVVGVAPRHKTREGKTLLQHPIGKNVSSTLAVPSTYTSNKGTLAVSPSPCHHHPAEA